MTIYIIVAGLLITGGLVSIMIHVRHREEERFLLWMRDFEFSLGKTVSQVDEENICRELFDNNIKPKAAVDYYLLKKETEEWKKNQ